MKDITYKRGYHHWKAFYKGTEIGVFHDITQRNGVWSFCAAYGYSGRGKTRLAAIENCIKERKRLFTLADVKNLNRKSGFHFFDRSTMSFFKSTIETGLLKGGYFITSEKNGNSSRRYTARKVDYLDGSIPTLGQFQEFSTKQLAKLAINIDRAEV